MRTYENPICDLITYEPLTDSLLDFILTSYVNFDYLI